MLEWILILLLCVAVFGKWLLIAIIFPSQVSRVKYKETSYLFFKIFATPSWLMEKIMRNGYERWMLYHVSYIPSCHLRRFIYRSLGCKMGKHNVFHFRTEIRDIHKLQIGGGNIVGDNALLDARRGLIIGNNVNISSNVSIYTLQHDHRAPDFSCKPEGGQVSIGDRVWLGSNVIILPGVTIGEGSVCCAGCVVTKDVEPYTVVAGIPAKKVNERPRDLVYEFSGHSCRLY